MGPWGTGVSPWVPLRRTEGHCYLGDSWEGTEKVAGRDRRGGPGPESEAQRPSLPATAATRGPWWAAQGSSDPTRGSPLRGAVRGDASAPPAHSGGRLPRGTCRVLVRTPGTHHQLLPWVRPSAASLPSPRDGGACAVWLPPDPPAAGCTFLVGRRPRARRAGLRPELTIQWDLGGAGGLLLTPPSVAGAFLSSEPGVGVGVEDRGSLASAWPPARLRPLAKRNYHRHGLGDKKLKTKDFKITSFQVGENGPWPGPRSHVTNSEVWVRRGMQINNSALRITRVCQPASFQRNRRGYKNPESFYRTPGASRRQKQSWERAGEPRCEEMPEV